MCDNIFDCLKCLLSHLECIFVESADGSKVCIQNQTDIESVIYEFSESDCENIPTSTTTTTTTSTTLRTTSTHAYTSTPILTSTLHPATGNDSGAIIGLNTLSAFLLIFLLVLLLLLYYRPPGILWFHRHPHSNSSSPILQELGTNGYNSTTASSYANPTYSSHTSPVDDQSQNAPFNPNINIDHQRTILNQPSSSASASRPDHAEMINLTDFSDVSLISAPSASNKKSEI